MNLQQIKQVLLIEMENKRWYTSEWRTICGECQGDINEGDEFIYMGERGHKVCNECVADITNFLEE